MRSAVALLALPVLGALAGCRSYTLTNEDCTRYREKLEAWARAKGKQSPEASVEFAKSCPGTTISRGTHECLEKASDEAAFFRCLD